MPSMQLILSDDYFQRLKQVAARTHNGNVHAFIRSVIDVAEPPKGPVPDVRPGRRPGVSHHQPSRAARAAPFLHALHLPTEELNRHCPSYGAWRVAVKEWVRTGAQPSPQLRVLAYELRGLGITQEQIDDVFPLPED